MTNKKLSVEFKKFLENKKFQEVLDMVKQNSSGKIWIIGGYVYKNLASILYGTEPYDFDIDFIVENKTRKLKEMPRWKIEVNRYGNPNYMRNDCKMSFTELKSAIRVCDVSNPTIDNFIVDTPLDIQSVAYDIQTCKLIGIKGIEAIKNKKISINNLKQAEFYATKKEKTLKEIIEEKGNWLGFTTPKI